MTTLPIITKDQEIRDLKRTLEKTRQQLEKALGSTIALSQRNSELRAAIHATINENPDITFPRLAEIIR